MNHFLHGVARALAEDCEQSGADVAAAHPPPAMAAGATSPAAGPEGPAADGPAAASAPTGSLVAGSLAIGARAVCEFVSLVHGVPSRVPGPPGQRSVE